MQLFLSQRSKGFTIIELLVVIVIIGILAAIVIVAQNGITRQARDAAVLSDADSLAGEVTRYSVKNNGSYGSAVEWYSEGPANANITFVPSNGNVIDIVANNDGYCIRVYNPDSETYSSLASAFTKAAPNDACETLDPSAAAQTDSPLPEVITYQTSFETGADGWTAGNAASTLSNDTTFARTGSRSIRMIHTGISGDGLRKTVSGLTIGQTYTWTGWVYIVNAGVARTAYWHPVSPFVSYSSGANRPFDTWVEVTKTFEATATSQYIFLYVENNNYSSEPGVQKTVYFDDFKVVED